MAEPISPPPSGPHRRSFSPSEAAALLRLAESDFVKGLARASLGSPPGPTAIPAEDVSGQDLDTLGGDARGGSVNLVI